jgi:hypothetical protein
MLKTHHRCGADIIEFRKGREYGVEGAEFRGDEINVQIPFSSP